MAARAAVMTERGRLRVQSAYMPVVIGGKLAFRYDPARRVIEWQMRGETHYIDLAVLEEMNALTEQQSKAQEGD